MRLRIVLLSLLVPLPSLAEQLLLEVGGVYFVPYQGHAFVASGDAIDLAVDRLQATLRIEGRGLGTADVALNPVGAPAQTLQVTVVKDLVTVRRSLDREREAVRTRDFGESLLIEGDTVRYSETTTSKGLVESTLTHFALRPGMVSSTIPSMIDRYREATRGLELHRCIDSRAELRRSAAADASALGAADALCSKMATDALALAATYREHGFISQARSSAERAKQYAEDPASPAYVAAQALLETLPKESHE